MACEEKLRLAGNYQSLTKQYSDAVTDMHRKMGTASKTSYDKLYRLTEALHAEVTKAQGRFNSHVQEHGC